MPEQDIFNQIQQTMQPAPSSLGSNSNASSSSQNSKARFSKKYKRNIGSRNRIKYFLGSFALLFLVFGGAAAYYLVQQEGIGDIRQQARMNYQLDGPCNSLCMDNSHCAEGLSCVSVEDQSSVREMREAELKEKGLIPDDCTKINERFFFKMRDNNYHKVILCNEGEFVYVEKKAESTNGRPEGASSAPWNWYYLADDSDLNLENGESNAGWSRFPTEEFFRGMTAYNKNSQEMIQIIAKQGDLQYREVNPKSGKWPDFQEMDPQQFSQLYRSTESGRFQGIIAYPLSDEEIRQIVARGGKLYYRELNPQVGREPDFQEMNPDEFPQWFNSTGSGEFQLIAAYTLADGKVKEIVARGGNFYYREFDPKSSSQPDFEKFESENFPGWETYGEIKVCRDPNCPEDSACSCTNNSEPDENSQPTLSSDQNQDEQQLCAAAGGEWKELPNSCVDNCNYRRNPDINCAMVLTSGCDCGMDQCWDGQDCQAINPNQTSDSLDVPVESTGDALDETTNDATVDGCTADEDCSDGQVCNTSTNECVTLTNSQILPSVKASLKGVPYQSGPIVHHPKEAGQEIPILVTLINVSDQSNEKVIDFIYDESSGAYQTVESIVYDNINSGPYIIVLKGPKHLATRYCYYGETDKSCRFQDLVAASNRDQAEDSNFIWLEPGKVDLDLSAQPVLAGDLPVSGSNKNEQDGMVNVYDYSFLISCLGNNSRTDECIKKADLDFSGQVNNIDLMLLRRTLSQVSDQF